MLLQTHKGETNVTFKNPPSSSGVKCVGYIGERCRAVLLQADAGEMARDCHYHSSNGLCRGFAVLRETKERTLPLKWRFEQRLFLSVTLRTAVFCFGKGEVEREEGDD